MHPSHLLNRRALLRVAGLATAGAAVLPLSEPASAEDRPYGPFRMGIQSYSLRGFDVDRALKETRELGLEYWESYNAHLPLSTEAATVAAHKDRLKSSGIRVVAYGVVGFNTDAAANRRVFEGAKALGIRCLSADPAPAAMDQLEQLVEEFKINIAIHNHGPGHRYGTLQSCVDAVRDRHKRIGVCVDTGHFLRSSENPVKVVETLGQRVLGVHMKDVKDARRFTILGQGDMDVVGTLKALRAMKYRELVALEYEENPKAPLEDIRACLTAMREAVQKL